MGVSKINKGTPKWMVIMENPIKMDDLGVPPFKETPILCVPGTGCSSPPTHRLVTRKKNLACSFLQLSLLSHGPSLCKVNFCISSFEIKRTF